MYDLGRKPEIAGPQTTSKEIYYPSMSITGDEIPEISEQKIGSKIALKMVGIVRGINKNKEGMSYDIEFRKCDVINDMSEDEYDKMSDEEKDKLDEKEVMEKEPKKDDTEE